MAPCLVENRISDCSGRILDGDDLERLHLAVVVTNRQILTNLHDVIAQAVGGFVIIIAGVVVIDQPSRATDAAGAMAQITDIFFPPPKSMDATQFLVLAPFRNIDFPLGIKRRHDVVAVLMRSCRMLLSAGKMQGDAFEIVRDGHGGGSS